MKQDNPPRQATVAAGSAHHTPPPVGWLPLRGPSGRLYGYIDPQTQTLEIKRPGKEPERIELATLLKR
jgi:hypothetical protein